MNISSKLFSKVFSLLSIIALCCSQLSVFANPADIDTSFDTRIPVGFDGIVTAIATQDDGKIIIGGGFSRYKSKLSNMIIRLYADGSIDTSFDSGTGFYAEFPDSGIRDIKIQPDGKIIVGGSFETYNGFESHKIIRLNTDGSIDTSFSVSCGFIQDIFTIALQPDGKIIVGGAFEGYDGITAKFIARLDTDGSIDTSFDSGNGFDDMVYTIALQSDGKIIVGGAFETYNGSAVKGLVRLNSDGSIDTSFDSGNGFNNNIYTIALQSDGKIIVGGSFLNYNGSAAKGIVRLNTGGSIDTSFDGGTGFYAGVNTIALQSDGKIIVGGRFLNYNGSAVKGLVRLNTGGSIDTSFDGDPFDRSIYTIALQSDGKIIVGGSFLNYNGSAVNKIARLDTDGSIDTSFDSGNGFNNSIYTIALQSDGKIIVGGDFETYNGIIINKIVRLDTDGSIDTSFDSGTGFNTSVNTIALQSDGKIIVGGAFLNYNGSAAKGIVRLDTDGSIDTSFDSGTGFNTSVNTIALQSDGKIIVGGAFETYNGSAAKGIVRLNSDGSIDTSFDSGTGFNTSVNTIALQSDGKIIVGGAFETYNGSAAKGIVRLNSDGSIDTSFDSGTGFNQPRTRPIRNIALQSDGKIIVGGSFLNYNGSAVKGLVRLNTGGSIDTSFDGDPFDRSIYTIVIQTDGKIIVGGRFPGNIARLNTDGSIDTTFDIDVGFNSDYINCISIQNDGNILVGGNFTEYKSLIAGYLVALYGDSEFVIIPDSKNTTTVEDEFLNKGYIKESNGDLDGSTAISLAITDGTIPIDLSLKNEDIKLSLPEDSQFLKSSDQTAYSGIISVPITKNIASLYDEEVLSAFKVGSSSRSLELSGGVATLSVPVDETNVGDLVNVYYSEDNGASWYLHGSFMVVNNSGDAYASFTTNHFTDFAITLPDTTSLTGSFIINNDAVSTTGQEVVLTLATTPAASNMRFSNNGIDRSVWEAYSTSKTRTLSSGYANKTVYAQFDRDGDGTSDVQTSDTIEYIDGSIPSIPSTPGVTNGGGPTLQKDVCEEDRDCSSSYYDNLCGPCDTENIPTKHGDISDSPYDLEVNDAYLWAYEHGITSMDTIIQANMEGNLIRSHMAKMIAEYAVSVLHKTPLTGMQCAFSDMTKQSDEMKYYATLICELGIMGLKADGTPDRTFNPQGKVTRAEFGTALSRLLYGSTYNLKAEETIKRYSKHLNALKKAGIMTKIENPLQEELRGRVLLMLHRATK